MLIAIFGTGRNGSSLLTRLLDGMDETYVHPVECNFLSICSDLINYARVLTKTARNATLTRLELNKKIPTKMLIDYYRFHETTIFDDYIKKLPGGIESYRFGPDWKKSLLKEKEYRPSDFVLAFLKAFAKWLHPNKQFKNYLFKTIETPYIQDYKKVFSEMKCIHLIRDPFFSYASHKRTSHVKKKLPYWYFNGDNLYTMIQRRWIPHAKYILYHFDKNDYLVKYEDIILKKE